ETPRTPRRTKERVRLGPSVKDRHCERPALVSWYRSRTPLAAWQSPPELKLSTPKGSPGLRFGVDQHLSWRGLPRRSAPRSDVLFWETRTPRRFPLGPFRLHAAEVLPGPAAQP